MIFVDENYTTEKYDVKVKRERLLDNLKNYFDSFDESVEAGLTIVEIEKFKKV